MKKLCNDLVIRIPKNKYQYKPEICRSQKVVGHILLKENANTKRSIETMERIVKLIQEGNPQWSGAKDVDYSQSAGSKIWCKNERNGVVKKKRETYW